MNPLTSGLNQQKTALTSSCSPIASPPRMCEGSVLCELDGDSKFVISHSVTHQESQQHDVARRHTLLF